MSPKEIKRTQERVGTEPDGFWGPLSIRACQAHLRQLDASGDLWPAQSGVEAFYGPHGEEDGYTPPLESVSLPFPVYYGDSKRWSLKAHEKCAESLERVFGNIAEMFPTEEERRETGIIHWDGIYSPRKMRGGGSWSMHAYAIATDHDAARNRNQSHWPNRSHMPVEIMECFAMEGWTSAGAFWSRDSMHFQATKMPL